MSYMIAEEYLRHHLSNPKRKLPSIQARGYNNPELKGNMVAMKENGLEISWIKTEPYYIVSYCVPTTLKDSPFYGLKRDTFLLIDEYDERTVREWNRMFLDPDDEYFREIHERARNGGKEDE